MGTEVDEHRSRPHDHIVEPIFAALRPGDAGEDAEPPPRGRGRDRGPRDGGLKWKLALCALCLLALAWVAKLVLAAQA
jgi:hypothetical protein